MTAHMSTLASNEFGKTADEQTASNDSLERISGIIPTPRRMMHLLARARGPAGMRARDLMSDAPAVLRASSNIRTAVEILHTLDIRYLPVVDDDGSLVGVLSDRELRTLRIPYFIGNEYIGNLQAALNVVVKRLLHSEVLSVDADASVTEALALMLHYKLAVVPVTDGYGVLVGVLNYMDMLRMLPVDVETLDAAE